MAMTAAPPDLLVRGVGYATRAMPGETACGDQCAVWLRPERIVLALADGLGHGAHAAHAAEAALRCIGARLDSDCDTLFAECDRQLRDTRGVALALAIVEPALARVTVAAVGNIRGVLLTTGRDRRLPGACGIVGAGYTGLVPERLALAPGDQLVLYSDGLQELLPLRELLCAADAPPQALAGTALQLWASERDDASILIYRYEGRGS
jgi:negative regulator of sigma-B (phosphoserine phosphatase)